MPKSEATLRNEMLFDSEMLGMKLRRARRDLGLSTTESASAYIFEKTGYTISSDAVYRIERGKQPPSTPQFFAFCLAYFGRLNRAVEIDSIIDDCACKAWREKDYATVYGEASEQTGGDSEIPDLCVAGAPMRPPVDEPLPF
ncbi:hypothetical protein DMP07_07645 [Slackia faecicanis]|uniref:HTH cro/C1-type domain-containing protein n=1 Tax=Slackia faecicanis TaxID=255723 RepID=A0A3N0ADJ3_9ACTN|nr:helix-turn-helix transcriptional regulator [Slackia faecicanis]RNL18820.1 hypothetical protein DMP07_07645 [Slackia faecicanis]